MKSERLRIQLRSKLDEWFVPLVVVLVVVLLVSGWGAYTAVAAPEEPTEYEQVETWSTNAEISHSAVVREPNAVYAVGDRVSDQPRYYTEVMPVVEGNLEYSYLADEGEVEIETETTQIIRSVEDSDSSTAYWSVDEPLNATQTTVEPNSQHTVSFAVDVDALDDTATETAESLGSTAGSLETVVEIEVSMEGTIDGEPVAHTETYELPIEITSGTYSLELPDETGHTETESVQTDSHVDRLSAAAGMLLVLVVSVGSLGTLVAAKRRERLAPTPAEQRAVEAASKQAELDEWISRGSIPPSLADQPRIEVASLAELVDVAIDCNRRVIEREQTAEYVVVDNETIYAYRADEPDRKQTEADGTEAHPGDETADTPTPANDASEPPSDVGDS